MSSAPSIQGADGLRLALGVAAAVLAVAVQGGAQEPAAPAAPADPRVGLKAGLRDAGEAARNMELVATLPKPEGFFDPKAPAGDPTGPERRRTTTPEAEVKDTGANPRAAGSQSAAAAAERAGLRELRPRVQRRPSLRRQLPRVQHLRHRGPEEGRSCSRRSCARAARATCRSTATCCSCRSSRRAAGSTAARRASRRRSAPSASAASASSTSATCASRSRWPPCRPAADRTRTRWSPTRRTRRTSTSTARARARCDRARSSRAAPDWIPKEDPNTALFSIDVIQVPLAAPEKARDRQPAAHLRRSEDRRHRGPLAGRRPRPGHADGRA